jgi:hypothetical protein
MRDQVSHPYKTQCPPIFINNTTYIYFQIICKGKEGTARPKQAVKHQSRSRDIAILLLNFGVRRGWLVATPRPLYPPGKLRGTHGTGGWVGPSDGWTDAENLAPTGIQPPDRPARSESLYRLSYRSPPKQYASLL